MKTPGSIVTLSFALFALSSCSKVNSEDEPSSIPNEVTQSFKTTYPNQTDVEWESEGDYFESEFEVNGKEKSVVFDKEGNIVLTETEINTSELPAAVIQYLANNYSTVDIEEAEKIESSEGLRYEVVIEIDDDEAELIFDGQGNFIELEQDEDDAGEEDDDDESDGDDENEREINPEELPQVIKDAIAQKYAGAELLEADEITQKDGSLTYDVEIKVNGEIIEVMYDVQGNFLGIEIDED
jgi:hypothetical protein